MRPRIDRAASISSAVTVSGGASRTTSSPAVRTRRPCSRAAATTSPAGDPRDGADEQPAAADARRPPGSAREPLGELRASHARRSREARRRPRRRPRLPRPPTRDSRRTSSRGRRARAHPRRRRRRAARRSEARWPRPLARATRSGRTPERLEREERSGATDPGLHLVEAEERRELGRGGHERLLERDDASLAEHRLEQDQPDLVVDRRPQRVDVVRRDEANAGDERLERERASRAGRSTESAPSVRPWNPPSSATTPGLPVALRAYLSIASIASAPELQKNACAPPNRSDSFTASSSAGSVR